MKRTLFPFYSFILFTLAFPHANLWLFAWVCLVPYLFFIYSENKWHKLIIIPSCAFFIPMAYGCFGFAYFSFLFYFIFVLFMTISIIPVTIILKFIIRKGMHFTNILRNIFIILSISSVWVTYEYFRSSAPIIKFCGGMLLGYSQTYNIPILQYASIFGVHGISFLIVALNSALFLLLMPLEEGERREKIIPFLIILFTIILVVIGYIKSSIDIEQKEEIKVGIIQPNTPPVRFWEWNDLDKREEKVITTLFQLMRQAALEAPDIIILPERAFHGNFSEGSEYGVSRIKNLAKELNIPLIIGATFIKGKFARFNSAYFISSRGEITDRYDKIGLFPFGEYVPAGMLIEKVINQTQLYKHFPSVFGIQQHAPYFSLDEYVNIDWLKAGTRPVVFKLNNKYSFSTPICTEDVPPSIVRSFVNRGAQFIAVITNDVWYRRSSMLYNHFFCSVFRAVENNVSVVRAANTGISAIILPNGRIKATVRDKKGREKMVKGYIVGRIPITNGKTFYNQYGYIFPVLCTLLAIIFFITSFFIPYKK